MNKTIIASALLLAGVAGLTSCGNEKKSESVPAIDLANMDTSVRPQDDFFRYVNGGWMDKNPLKPEYSRYGIFDKLGKRSRPLAPFPTRSLRSTSWVWTA